MLELFIFPTGGLSSRIAIKDKEEGKSKVLGRTPFELLYIQFTSTCSDSGSIPNYQGSLVCPISYHSK
jgi:hypothetical protein